MSSPRTFISCVFSINTLPKESERVMRNMGKVNVLPSRSLMNLIGPMWRSFPLFRKVRANSKLILVLRPLVFSLTDRKYCAQMHQESRVLERWLVDEKSLNLVALGINQRAGSISGTTTNLICSQQHKNLNCVIKIPYDCMDKVPFPLQQAFTSSLCVQRLTYSPAITWWMK